MGQVRDIMQKNVITIEHDKSALDAAKLISEKDISFLVILKDEKPIGVVTERDFVERYAAKGISLSNPVKDIMTLSLITIDPNDTIWEAAELMKTHNIHKLPVIKDKKIVGIITNSDLVKLCSLSSDSEMRRICDDILTRMK